MRQSILQKFPIFLGVLVASVVLIGLLLFFTRDEQTDTNNEKPDQVEFTSFDDSRYSITFKYPSNCDLSDADEIEKSAPESIRNKYNLDMLLAAECEVEGIDLRLSVEKYQFSSAEKPEVMFNKLLIDSAQEGMNIDETSRKVDDSKITIEYENSFLFTKYLSHDVFFTVDSEGYLFSFSSKKGDWEKVLDVVENVEDSISTIE